MICFDWCSIGSLGKDPIEDGVENVTVKSCGFINTQNGVRIKSWGRPSSGFARNIRFQHITVTNVHNPIIIDQNYCPHNQGCPGQVRIVWLLIIIIFDSLRPFLGKKLFTLR